MLELKKFNFHFIALFKYISQHKQCQCSLFDLVQIKYSFEHWFKPRNDKELQLTYMEYAKCTNRFQHCFNFAFLREGLKKQKKIWIYPHLGGWVVQDGDNIHKKQKKHAQSYMDISIFFSRLSGWVGLKKSIFQN